MKFMMLNIGLEKLCIKTYYFPESFPKEFSHRIVLFLKFNTISISDEKSHIG
jgi:hypothetical protein